MDDRFEARSRQRTTTRSISTPARQGQREQNVLQAIAAGKHVYCEKPLATTLKGALAMARAAEKAGVKHGVVQDKLFLPGMRKLRGLSMRDSSAAFFRCAAILVTGCLKGMISRRSGLHGITKRKRTAESFSTCSATGATCSTTRSAPCRRFRAQARRTFPSALTRRAKRYKCTAEDAAYGMFELEGRHLRADQLVVGHARVSRRAVEPAGGRHRGQRRGGTAGVQNAESRQHAAAGVESGSAQSF